MRGNTFPSGATNHIARQQIILERLGIIVNVHVSISYFWEIGVKTFQNSYMAPVTLDGVKEEQEHEHWTLNIWCWKLKIWNSFSFNHTECCALNEFGKASKQKELDDEKMNFGKVLSLYFIAGIR